MNTTIILIMCFLGPLIGLILFVKLFGELDIKKAIGFLSFFLSFIVTSITGNLLFLEFFWVLSVLLIEDWKVNNQEAAPYIQEE